jgi:hypothetical protein
MNGGLFDNVDVMTISTKRRMMTMEVVVDSEVNFDACTARSKGPRYLFYSLLSFFECVSLYIDVVCFVEFEIGKLICLVGRCCGPVTAFFVACGDESVNITECVPMKMPHFFTLPFPSS